MSGPEPPWNEGDETNSDEPYPLLPQPDRLWRHPSEASKSQDESAPKKQRRSRGLFFRHPRGILVAVSFAGLLVGSALATAINSVASVNSVSIRPQPAMAVVLPSGISAKIARISSAITQIRSSSGNVWQAATFITSANYLVTSAGSLTTNELLMVRDTANNWKALQVTAVDPLTDSAILKTQHGSASYLSSYLTDSPPNGALEELVFPKRQHSGTVVTMAEVITNSTPLTLSKNFYVPNSIELVTQAKAIPLGTLVLDPEGDPVGIVVKTQAIKSGLTIYASPMPSISRIANLIAKHLGIRHGYLGVVGKTVPVGDNASYSSGVQINSVTTGSPADNSHLMVGGVIVSIDGNLVGSLPALQSILLSSEPGSQVMIGVLVSGRFVTFRVALANHP